MDGETWQVGDVMDLDKGKLVLSVIQPELNDRIALKELSFAQIREQYRQAVLRTNISGEFISCPVEAVEVSASIADFRNVFLVLDRNPQTLKIKQNQLIELHLPNS